MLCTRPRITRVVPGGNAWNTVPQAGVISAITPATFALSCRKTLITAMPLKEFDSRCWMLLTGFVVHNRDQLFFCFMRGQQFHAGKVAANLLAPQLYVSMNPLAVTTEVPPLTHDQVLIRAIYAQVPPAARASRRTLRLPLTQPGDGIFAALVGELVDGPADGPAAGTIVTCYADWEEYSIVPVSQIRPLAAEGSLFHHLGLLGHNGLAAYFGIEGFLTEDFMSEWSDALDQLAGWRIN
jgi:N-terminal domain of oxidoreductase